MKRLAIISVLSVLLFTCTHENPHADHSAHDHAKEEASVQKYTCPMHPHVMQDAPGKCPICGMELVSADRSNGSAGANDLMLNDSQMKLANVTTRKVSMQPVGQTVLVNGKLVENKDLSEVISSRVSGRIERLSVKETGRTIQKGEPLFQIYSETLLTLQREFLLAKEQFETLGSTEKRYKSFFDASKRKLLLYGLTETQIDKIGQNKAVQNTITFLSPASGVVTEINVSEGQYIAEGTTLMRIENINQLWLEAELYPAETSLAKKGDKISARISGFENEPVEATINFLSPEYSANSQITVMRASIPNLDLKFKPGMQAQVFFKHSAKKALTLPIDAVIRDEKGSHVYVQRGLNTFRPVMIETGLEDFDSVEITAGLTDGDTVAVTGAYLLYSEIILKKGTDPMAGHSH